MNVQGNFGTNRNRDPIHPHFGGPFWIRNNLAARGTTCSKKLLNHGLWCCQSMARTQQRRKSNSNCLPNHDWSPIVAIRLQQCTSGVLSKRSGRRCRCLHARPHGSEFCIGHNRGDIELDAKAFDPRCEMGPHFADVCSHRNRHSFSTDWITNAVLQFKTFEVIAGPSRIDVSGK